MIPPLACSTGLVTTLMGSTGTGWALRRGLIKLLSAGWVPHVRDPSWAIPV